MSEEQLTYQILQGDEAAFRRLFLTQYDRLLAYVLRFADSQEDAEDIVQQSFMHLWEQVTKDPKPQMQSVINYLFIMVRNATLDYIRLHDEVVERILRIDEQEFGEGLYLLDYSESSDQDTLYNELLTEIKRIIQTMPERQREVFLLSRDQKLKNTQIAEKLGITVKAVEKHITSALRLLKTHLPIECLFIIAWLAEK